MDLTFLYSGVQLSDPHCQQVHPLLQVVHPQGETVGLCEQFTKDVLSMPTCTMPREQTTSWVIHRRPELQHKHEDQILVSGTGDNNL